MAAVRPIPLVTRARHPIEEQLRTGGRKRQRTRGYVGASTIGHPCEAHINLHFRHFFVNELDRRIQRIFKMGHVLEDMILTELFRTCDDYTVDRGPNPHQQYRWDAKDGHLIGHPDGILTNIRTKTKHVLEIKTMNKDRFEAARTAGIRVSHPGYWMQCQALLGLGKGCGHALASAILVAINKNNADIHVEEFDPDEFAYMGILERVEQNVLSTTAERIAFEETDWRCRDCSVSDACWGRKMMPASCATCRHSVSAHNKEHTFRNHCTLTNTAATGKCKSFELWEPTPRGTWS